jgi:hypothetical protein
MVGIHNGFHNGKANAAPSIFSGMGFINLIKFRPELIQILLPFSVVVLGNFRRFLLVIFLFLFLHLDFSFIYNKFSMPFWDFFY